MILLLVMSLLYGQVTPVCAVPTKRHSSVVKKFERMTGYKHGRPGYIVDHIIPLCACGADSVTNMQWQDVVAALYKDIDERAQCRALRAANETRTAHD